MTFLAPAAGLIAVGLAVPALLAMYFLKLRRRPVRVSSTLLWQSAVQDLEVNTPWRWLKASLLLLLHLLLVGALCAAIGRPVLDNAWNGDDASRIILAIDCSASMGATLGDNDEDGHARTRLDEAKSRAIELIDSLARSPGGLTGARPKIMVVAVAGEGAGGARIVGGFTSSTGAARDAVNAITQTDRPNVGRDGARDGGGEGGLGMLSDIVRAQTADLREEPLAGADGDGAGHAASTHLVVLTDGGLFDGVAHPVAAFPDGVRTTVLEVPGAEQQSTRERAGNVGIAALSARREYDNPALVRVFARLVGDAPQAVRVLVECRVDGELARTKSVELPGADPNDAERRLGEAGVTFELTMGVVGASPKLVTVRVVGEAGGLLAADDSASLVMSPAVKPRVLVVTGGEDARANVFLMGVLEAMDLGSLRVVDAAAYATMLAGAAADADERRARAIAYDLVIFDRVEDDEGAPIVVPRGVPTISFGAAAGLPGVHVARTDDRTGRVATWKRSHPAMQGVSLDDVVVRGVPRVIVGDDAERQGVRNIETLATIASPGTSAAGPMVVACQYAGARRLVVACGLDLATTNWGTLVSMPIFVAGATDYLTQRAEADAGRFFTTAQAVTVNATDSDDAGATLEGPIGAAEDQRVTLTTTVRGGVANFGIVDRVGVYRVAGDGVSPADAIVAANLVNERESDLRSRPIMSRLQGTMVEHHGDVRGESRGALGGEPHGSQGLGRKELWPWLVGAAVVLMCVEWMVYAWRLRV